MWQLVLDFDEFPNPVVQEIIPMASYFNVGNTEFSWEGTIVVNGDAETIKIHTHYIDALETTLSIHRDGRYNNKSLDVSIDGNDIVSYTAIGLATVQGFGGTMYEQ